MPPRRYAGRGYTCAVWPTGVAGAFGRALTPSAAGRIGLRRRRRVNQVEPCRDELSELSGSGRFRLLWLGAGDLDARRRARPGRVSIRGHRDAERLCDRPRSCSPPETLPLGRARPGRWACRRTRLPRQMVMLVSDVIRSSSRPCWRLLLASRRAGWELVVLVASRNGASVSQPAATGPRRRSQPRLRRRCTARSLAQPLRRRAGRPGVIAAATSRQRLVVGAATFASQRDLARAPSPVAQPPRRRAS